MNEAEVVSIICEHLQNERWQFWIDDHPIHANLAFKKHCLLIGGARPDIFGFNRFKQVFAVEVKGLKDYKKAIGQALTYKSGVNISYIGGVSSKLDEIKNIAIPSGLGLIPVDESTRKVKTILDPLYTIYPYYIEDIKNELEVLKSQKKGSRSFASFGRTHVLNYLAPIFLFQKSEIKQRIALVREFEAVQWKNKTYRELIKGANIIGLLDITDNGYKLSKIGEFCLEYLKSLNITSLSELEKTISNSGGNKSVYSEYSHLAKFLQLIYLQNLDFKKFVTILLNFEKKTITAKDIIDKLILDYPNLFINFFVKNKAKSKVIEIFLKGEKNALMEDYNKTVREYGQYNFFFAFKRHLVHIGILSDENITYYEKKEHFDAEEDLWILGNDILI